MGKSSRIINVFNVAIVCLFAVYALFFNYAIGNMYKSFIASEYKNWKTSIDMLCDEIEYFQPSERRAEALARAITAVDANAGTFAAMYDRDLAIVSGRSPVIDTPFEPMAYPDLVRMFQAAKRGEATVWFDMPGVEPHDLHVYFRWVGDALIVMGVSKITVDAAIGSYVTRMSAYMMAASFVCFVLIAGLVAREEWGKRHARMAANP